MCLRCGRRSFGAPACLVRSDSPRLLRNWRGCQPVVTDWHCAPAFLAGCGTRSARHAAPPFRDGRMNARRHALVRSDRAVPSCAACGVAKAARCATIGGGCQPRRATQEERARSRVQRARPRSRNPRSREDERTQAPRMSAGSAARPRGKQPGGAQGRSCSRAPVLACRDDRHAACVACIHPRRRTVGGHVGVSNQVGRNAGNTIVNRAHRRIHGRAARRMA